MKLVPYRRYEMRPWWLAADRSWIDEFFGDFVTDDEDRSRFVPSVDIKENKKSLVVKAEIPGMDAKDIDLTLEKDMLIISGERTDEKEEEDENYYRRETSYGSFRRSLKLPVEVEADKIKADYKNGVLTVKLPKAGGKAAKAITVETH
ncbi:MAG: Hsp20/alpha crystallin family protein [Deltaproteobacteria bacterium]|nr:Hsp20/alpha crystallin family protein [Candidatus Zymogenaceae bacterium]